MQQVPQPDEQPWSPISMYYKSDAKGSSDTFRDTESRYGNGTSPPKPRKPQNYYEYLPPPAIVKPLSRPIMDPPAKKNVQSELAQMESERRAFEKRAAIYRKHSQKQYHHHRAPEQAQQHWPDDHIGDRGRHKPQWCSSTVTFDPITSMERPIGKPGKVDMRPGSSSSPGSLPSSSQDASPGPRIPQVEKPRFGRRPGAAGATLGKYNPLTHTWQAEPDSILQKQRQREFDRLAGVHGLRTGIAPPQRSYKTIFRSVGSLSELKQLADQCENEPQEEEQEKQKKKAGMRRVMNGRSWGTYNPLTHEWVVPPQDPAYRDQQALHDRHVFLNGAHSKRSEQQQQKPVYDPIKGTLSMPPKKPAVPTAKSAGPPKSPAAAPRSPRVRAPWQI